MSGDVVIRSFAGPQWQPSTKRRTLNAASVFSVLIGSLAAGAFGGFVVWAFCEFDLLDVRDLRIS